MEKEYLLSQNRIFSEEEKTLIWKKPPSHVESVEEKRITKAVKSNWNKTEMKITNILLEGDAGSGKTQLAKALSANFGLPYTKITCFADMDKSDVLGSILPVSEDNKDKNILYKYFPSEIVRAYENGWLLEIQEPTVIRDASVLMALNSALELNGSLNLPNRIVHRHPDFIAVITTNRGYNGYRPLNEALRDRIQHAEKMDLPPLDVMIKRGAMKTNCNNHELLSSFAKTIITLDKSAKANAIKGVAGMRSYFYWIDAVMEDNDIIESLYNKVIYKITTDEEEISILEEALETKEIFALLENINSKAPKDYDDFLELKANGNLDSELSESDENKFSNIAIRRRDDSEGYSDIVSENSNETSLSDTGENGNPMYHEMNNDNKEEIQIEKDNFRKELNKYAREAVKGSLHEKIGMIVHRPEGSLELKKEYNQILSEISPVIRELSRKTLPILEHEESTSNSSNKVYGTVFKAEKIASSNFKYFSKKNPPDEKPSLAVALRIDQSASMHAFGRLEAAKKAAVAVYEFCKNCSIPVLIYGDTADRSPKEKMSMYSYIDWDKPDLNDKTSLMGIKSISNNRDGMALRILSEKLVKAPQTTKLLISISDGQPKALPYYSGDIAINDMKKLIKEFSRKGILFLAAAIGKDKETICDIYGQERYIDITNLNELPVRLVKTIARYL